MAESSSLVSRQLLFDVDADTPVPAAEVLIDLKESARRRSTRYSASSLSPQKRKNCAGHRAQPSSKRFAHAGKEREMSLSDGSEEEQVHAPCVVKRRKGSHNSDYATSSRVVDHAWIKHMKTFLRLPKALTWCRYEWFCSDIDRPFLVHQNDFSQCLEEMFPQLKTRHLTRVQWRILRRMLGKPRRCSATFLAEERSVLAEQRQKLREFQCKVHQGMLTSSDFNSYRDLPDRVPAILTVGTRVTAWLIMEKEKGFHSGTVQAVDLENHQYWITFDRLNIGKHALADTDIKSMYPCEMISLSSLEAAHINRQSMATTPPRSCSLLSSRGPAAVSTNPVVVDPLLASSPASRRHGVVDSSGSMGGFPTDLLRQVVQMSKLLSLKQDRVKRLNDMNTDAEKMHSRHFPLTPEFQRRYAMLVIDLDDINRQLNMRSEAVKKHCNEIGYGEIQPHISSTQECMERARTIAELSNKRLKATDSEVKDPGVLTLIAKLTSIMLQIEMLSQEGKSQDLGSLQNSITEALCLVHNDNQRVFQKHVETPLALIQSGMNPSDSLHPFSVTSKKPHRTLH